jgi:hypothetical protein
MAGGDAVVRPRRARRGRRSLWLAIQLGIVTVLLLGVGTVGFIEYSAQPGFCNNCHNMVPYYDSWASSSHNEVACVKCHYAPGIKAEAMGKLQAANQVVKYITGTYGLRPWAEIEDAACLRSGCHATRKLEGEVTFSGVRFDHTAHLGELRRGKRLRCTSCHSQIVQGEHLTVTQSTCFLCHFKDRPVGDPVAGCTGCHPSPPRVVSPAGFVVEHSDYVRDMISCTSCHDNVRDGSGTADRSRCLICHNEPERLEQFDNTDFMHRTHIAEHNVECAQCHLEIQHRAIPHAASADLDCRSCHQQTHDSQRQLYAGTGGHGTAEMPSSMFLANVSCNGCHELTATVRDHETVDRAGEASCMSCHGTRYANILPGWKEAVDRKTAQVAAIVRDVRAAAGAANRTAHVDSLLAAASANLGLVRDGHGVHNIAFADELLRLAVQYIREAVRGGGLPYSLPAVDLGPSVTGNECMQCHLGTERRAVAFRGGTFDHEPHVLRSGIGCGACHSPMDEHGQTRITSTAQCQACHHRSAQPIACERCHTGPGGAPANMLITPAGDFQHGVHVAAGVSCATCHQSPEMDATGINCGSCHETHHQIDSNCLSCHRPSSGVLEMHDVRDAHAVQCERCHAGIDELATWSREICTVCHVEMVEHEAAQPCESCHQMPARRVQVGLLDGIEPNGGRRRSIFPPGGHFALSNPA